MVVGNADHTWKLQLTLISTNDRIEKKILGACMEIERKFKLKYLPNNLGQYSCKELEQGYLCDSPAIRIRKSGTDFFLTYKSEPFVEKDSIATCCEEYEMPLTKDAYLHLKEKIDGFLIQKTRYLIPLETGFVAELDIFHGFLEGLQCVEVEFKSKEEAACFLPPLWFGEDISMEDRYKNRNLAKIQSIDGY